MAITILPSMEMFGEGQHVEYTDKRQMREHNAWYENDYNNAAFFPANNLLTGMKLAEPNEREYLPLFQIASDFLGAAALGEMPGTTGNDMQEAWLDEHKSMWQRSMRRATRYWSIHDFAVLVAEQDFIRAIDPIAYYRVGEPDQADALVGHILAYEYKEPVLQQLHSSEYFAEVPDRIRVDKIYPTGDLAQGEQPMNTTQIFHFDGGSTIGELIEEYPSPITAVCVAGEGAGWYQGAKDIAARIILEKSLINIDLNRHRNRIQVNPTSVVQAILDQFPDEIRAQMSISALAERYISETKYPMGTIDDHDQQPMFVGEGINLESNFTALQTTFNLFYMASGIPPTAFGIGIGAGESGTARERATDAAGARVRVYRRDLSDCYPILCAAAGMPAGPPVGFVWASPAFVDRIAYQEELIRLKSEGIISAEEVRSALGYRGAPPIMDDASNQQPMAQSDAEREE